MTYIIHHIFTLSISLFIDTAFVTEYCANTMNDTEMLKSAITKTLAVIGFFVTFALLIALLVAGITKVPSAFSSLASIIETMDEYKKNYERPTKTSTVTENNDVAGDATPSNNLSQGTNTTAVNTSVAVASSTAVDVRVHTPVAYSDLRIAVLEGGVIKNGVFSSAKSFEYDAHNAIKFDVRNIGTKSSGTWVFTITLSSGRTYTSAPQAPLHPHSGVISVFGFDITDEANELIVINSTVISSSDSNSANNSATFTIPVKD